MMWLNWMLNSGFRNPVGEGEKNNLFVDESFENQVLVAYLLCKLRNMNAKLCFFLFHGCNFLAILPIYYACT